MKRVLLKNGGNQGGESKCKCKLLNIVYCNDFSLNISDWNSAKINNYLEKKYHYSNYVKEDND